MNILLINHYAGSPQHGMEYRPYYLGREWVQQGHHVTVVAASFSHVRRHQPPRDRAWRENVIDGVRYVWLRAPAYAGNGLGRIRNMLTFLYRLWRHQTTIVGAAAPDAVIASSTYPLDIYPASRIARQFHARLVFEVHDLWPLSPKELGGLPAWHPFIFTMQRAEDFACRQADRIVSILPKADAHLVTRGMAPEKFFHVPNGVCVPEWEQASNQALPDETARVLQRHRAAGRFLVGYAGAHGLANSLGVLVEAAQRLRDAPVTFVLVGQGPEKQPLQQQVEARGLHNVLLLPPVPRGCVPAFARGMDALYIGLARQPLFRFGVSPNKLFDYMMAARPVIHAIEAGNDLVAESGCGVSVPAEDPDAVAGAVRALAALTPPQRAAMGERGRKYALEHHDYRVLAAGFLETLEEAVAVGSRAGPSQKRAA